MSYKSLDAYLDSMFDDTPRSTPEDRADFYEEEYKLEFLERERQMQLDRERQHECGSTGSSDLAARGRS